MHYLNVNIRSVCNYAKRSVYKLLNTLIHSHIIHAYIYTYYIIKHIKLTITHVCVCKAHCEKLLWDKVDVSN